MLISSAACIISSDHGDVISEPSGIANGRLDAGVRDEPDGDELDAVLFELQV